MPKRETTRQRSPCPIANTLDLIGDRWSLLIIRDMFAGSRTYSDFQQAPEGIPTNILADRLKRLQAAGLVEKKPYQDKPVRYAYQLTEKGRGLRPVLKSMAKWGLENLPGTKARIKI